MPNEILYLLLGVLSLCGLLKVTSIHTKYAVQNNSHRREFLRGGRMKMTLNQIMALTPHYILGYVIEEQSPPGLKKSNLAEFSQGETEKSDLNPEFRGAGVEAG